MNIEKCQVNVEYHANIVIDECTNLYFYRKYLELVFK